MVNSGSLIAREPRGRHQPLGRHRRHQRRAEGGRISEDHRSPEQKLADLGIGTVPPERRRKPRHSRLNSNSNGEYHGDIGPEPPPHEEPPPPLPLVSLGEWANKEIPDQEWAVRNCIPLRNVTLFSGEGEIGKSILFCQLAVAHVLGSDWIGMLTNEYFETCFKKGGRGKAQRSLDLIGAMYAAAAAAYAITGRGIGYKLFVAKLIASMATNDMQRVYRLLKETRERDYSLGVDCRRDASHRARRPQRHVHVRGRSAIATTSSSDASPSLASRCAVCRRFRPRTNARTRVIRGLCAITATAAGKSTRWTRTIFAIASSGRSSS
jgi:hypothetical protein